MRCLPRNLHFEVHKVLCLSRTLHVEVHKALYLPRNLHVEVQKSAAPVTNSARQGSQSAVPAGKSARRDSQSAVPVTKSTKSANEPHVEKHCTCHSLKITTMSKVLHLPRKMQFKVKPLRSLAPVTKSRLTTTKTRGFSCACHEKSPPCAKMHTAPQRERSRWKHPPQTPRFSEPAQSKCMSTILRGMNVL